MTTLRDLLNDFAEEIIETTLAAVSVAENERITIVNQTINEEKERLLDEYIETIKNRIVG